MEPLISVIVPIYDVENYIHKCINSLINQSYKNIEIILVDDESPDNCGLICDEYKSKDERIIVIHQKNKGLSGARNSGLEIASGSYISFVDSDDWVGEKMYEVMLNLSLKYNLDIIECGVNETGFEKEYNHSELNMVFENSLEALIRIIKNSEFSVWRRLYKKEAICGSRFLLNKTSEDIYFAIENIPKVKKMGYIKFPFYNYRLNPSSITKSKYNLRRFDDTLDAVLNLEEELKPLIFTNGEPNQGIKNQKLFTVVYNFILNESVYHYKMMNYYPNLDPKYAYRKQLKKLIDKNYFYSKRHNIYTILANLLSVYLFEIIVKVNKMRHIIFKTNHFS